MRQKAELISKHFRAWAIDWKIDLVHIQPGKPTQNGAMESFNGKMGDESLNTSWFWNLFDARRKISAWKIEYNPRRPHSSLRYLTPDEFARQWKAASLSAAENMRAMISYTGLDEEWSQVRSSARRCYISGDVMEDTRLLPAELLLRVFVGHCDENVSYTAPA